MHTIRKVTLRASLPLLVATSPSQADQRAVDPFHGPRDCEVLMYGRDTSLRMQLQRRGTAKAYRNLISLCHPLPCEMCLRLASNANAVVGNAEGARGSTWRSCISLRSKAKNISDLSELCFSVVWSRVVKFGRCKEAFGLCLLLFL